MKRLKLFIAILSFVVINSAWAQDVNWRSITDNQKYLASLYFGADYSSYFGASYGYLLKNKITPVVIGGEFILPFGKQILDDWKGKLSIQAEVWHNDHFSFSIKPSFVVRKYESPLALMYNTAADLSVNFGYLRPKWGLLAIACYDKNISTYIKNEKLKEYYPEIRDGWYGTSGGTFKFGIRGQYTFNSWSAFLTVGKHYGENFKDNPTLPFFAEVSVQKWF
ncbi:MAG: hypothetical protein J7604_16455 [Sporocytophaga sp.]|uniref:hypothetical protein n=1 Tax=Sporocytophaga sp. TaxID=2231183 RepID=UPI001B0440E0|nr:hypothetical protein [Sporocytophaga sp.]MBO9701800.1 hypothetical protein [Sporocytophaga sp.]